MEYLKNALAEAEKRAAKGTSRPRKTRGKGQGDPAGALGCRKKCESLERNIADQEIELTKARQSAHGARVEAQGALQEIQEARKIVAGKAFIM